MPNPERFVPLTDRPDGGGGAVTDPMTNRASDLVREVADAIADVLGRRIGEDENFFDAGLTSASIVAVHQKATAGRPRSFPATILFARPNLGRLRTHLSAADDLEPRPHSADAERRRSTQARRRLRAQIERGSDDE